MADDSDDKEVLAALDKEASEYLKDAEISRILNAFKLDAYMRRNRETLEWLHVNALLLLRRTKKNSYAILDLKPGVPESDIKAQFRRKSLLIHPDKTKNPQAPDAFDRLKKAQGVLMDEKLRERLDEAIADARMLLIRERKWTVDNPELTTDEFAVDWREKTKHVLIDNELRKRKQLKAQMAEEGREKRKVDEEIDARKRKRESEQAWEETRDQRISSWRDFKTKGEASKKKKKKQQPIG